MALAVEGCAPTHSVRVSDADAQSVSGPRPDSEKAENAIITSLKAQLKDPNSLKQFQIVQGPVFVNHDLQVGLLTTRHVVGWLYCAEYNAKNSYGAYGGVERMAFLLHNRGSIQELGVLGEPVVIESSRGCG